MKEIELEQWICWWLKERHVLEKLWNYLYNIIAYRING